MTFLKSLFTNKKRLAVLLIIILIIGYFVYKNMSAVAAPARYVLDKASTQTIIVTVAGTGQVQAENQLDIKPQTDGRLTAVNIKQNQPVKKGDVLGIIDQQSAANSVAQAKAGLDQAQANYDKLISGATQDSVQAQQISIQSAQQNLAQAKNSYANTVITQKQAVDKAYSNLLNSALEADPSDTLSTVALTISGSYNGTAKGSFTISTSETGSGTNYSSSGLGNGNGAIIRGLSLDIGSGLFVTFSQSGTINPSTIWTINIPNNKDSNYLNNQSAYNSAVQAQTSALQNAQAAIDSAQNSLDKANNSYQTTIAPPTQADIASAKAQITSAQAQLANAQTAYSATILTAPFDGVVAAVDFSLGDKMTAGTTFATVITQQRVAKITLNEVDVAKVKLGQKATMTFDAIDGLQMTGSVAQIDTLGTVSQGVVSYGVQIAMDTTDDRIKPGMSVNASIMTDVQADVLSVPNGAVQAQGTQSYVQTLDPKMTQSVVGQTGVTSSVAPTQVTITTGASDDTYTQITGGSLKDGDTIVTQTINSSNTKSTAASATSALRLGGGGGFGGGGGAVRVGGATATGR